MWERMSYYGMRALLVLYMTGAVTLANAGLGMRELEAQAIYGIYVGMVYFLAVPGGWLGDNLFGHQRAVLYGAVIIALGHLILAVPIESGLFGLGLVAIGSGLLKSNISTIVGKIPMQTTTRVVTRVLRFFICRSILARQSATRFVDLWEKMAGTGLWCSRCWHDSGRYPVCAYTPPPGHAGLEPNPMPRPGGISWVVGQFSLHWRPPWSYCSLVPG